MKRDLIKTLQRECPRGAPIDLGDLTRLGISSALAHHYVKSGWLERLGRGVFKFPKDKLDRDACLDFLVTRIDGFHVGGKTALAWRGVLHNLPARELISLWGDQKAVMPKWFREAFPSRYTARNPFGSSLPRETGLSSLPESPDGPPVSEPERALLEMLSEVGIHQGIGEGRNIMEGIRSIRTAELVFLLKNCRRVKVMRLCVCWAEELNLSWANEVRDALGSRLGDSRWSMPLKDGKTLTLKN